MAQTKLDVTQEYPPIHKTYTVQIGTVHPQLTEIIDLAGATPVAIQMPAAWTAANLTFLAGRDENNMNDLYDSAGTEVAVTAAASRYIVLDPQTFHAMRFLRIRSGTAATPVTQTAARTLYLVVRPI